MDCDNANLRNAWKAAAMAAEAAEALARLHPSVGLRVIARTARAVERRANAAAATCWAALTAEAAAAEAASIASGQWDREAAAHEAFERAAWAARDR